VLEMVLWVCARKACAEVQGQKLRKKRGVVLQRSVGWPRVLEWHKRMTANNCAKTGEIMTREEHRASRVH
jgi:hypothetical protein